MKYRITGNVIEAILQREVVCLEWDRHPRDHSVADWNGTLMGTTGFSRRTLSVRVTGRMVPFFIHLPGWEESTRERRLELAAKAREKLTPIEGTGALTLEKPTFQSWFVDQLERDGVVITGNGGYSSAMAERNFALRGDGSIARMDRFGDTGETISHCTYTALTGRGTPSARI